MLELIQSIPRFYEKNHREANVSQCSIYEGFSHGDYNSADLCTTSICKVREREETHVFHFYGGVSS